MHLNSNLSPTCLASMFLALTKRKSATANGRNDQFDQLTSSHDFCTGETISTAIVAPTKQSCWSKQSKAASSGGDLPLRSACRSLLSQV